MVFVFHIAPKKDSLSLCASPLFCSREELPDKPNYGSGYENDREEVINLQWIAPRKSVEIGSYDISSFRIGAPDLEKDLVEGRRRLHLYSAVKYRGILEDKVYRSTFCYVTVLAGVQMVGPYDYNQYT